MGPHENPPHGRLGSDPLTGHAGENGAEEDILPDDSSFLLFLDKHWPRARPTTSPTVTLTEGLSGDLVPNTVAVDSIGRFKIRRELGRGGFATVYLAHDPLRDCDIALKVPYPSLRHSADLRHRFQREARAAASLDHPHINAIYETGQSASDFYISSHYCPGSSLAEWLKPRITSVSPDSAARLIMVLAGAVQHAHERGILHRDLKPGNVLLEQLERPFGPEVEESMFEGFFPRLCDFGLARILDNDPGDARTRTGILLGTPRYMAPEQASGQSLRVGPRTDIYALGVILYELLVGRPPFVADTDLETLRQVRSEEPVSIRRLQPSVPRDLNTICMKCLEKEPDRRYASAGHLESDLRRFLHHSDIFAKPVSPARRAWLWTRRHPVQAVVLLVGMLIVVALPAGLTWHNTRLQRAFRIADEERVRAQTFEAEARASERLALTNAAAVEQHMYSSDMRLANELLKDGEFAAAAALINRNDAARAGAYDPRGFEWWFLRRFRDVEQRTWRAHSSELNLLAFSADVRTLMTASYADRTAKTWNLETGALLATFPTRRWDEARDHEAGALSPDGKTAVTLVEENRADVWDAKTGRQQARLRRRGKVFCAAFSLDGRWLALGDEQATTIWRCGSWDKPENTIPGTRLLQFSRDSQLLATAPYASQSTEMMIYNVAGFTLKQKVTSWFPVQEMAFSPDGRTIATLVDAARGTAVQLWNPQTAEWVQNLNWRETYLRGISYSADGKLLASLTRDGSLRFWDLDFYEPRGAFRGTTNRLTRFQYSPDGRLAATATDQGTVSLWTAALLTGPEPISGRSRACESHLVFNPKRNQIAAAERDGRVALIDPATGQTQLHLSGNVEHAEDIAFSPDGQRVATVDKRHVRCWDTANGRQVWQVEQSGAFSVAWSPLGTPLAIGGLDNHVQFLDAATGRTTTTLEGHTAHVTMLRFFPDGKRLASASFDNTIRIWDVDRRREVTPPLGHLVPTFMSNVPTLKVPILSLGSSPTGGHLVAGLPLGHLVLWKTDGAKPLRSRDVTWTSRFSAWAAGRAPAIGFSPDGSILGSAGPGGLFRAIDISTLELAFALDGRGVAPISATWLANGSALATATEFNEITLWNTSTWQGRRVFGGPLSLVSDLAYSGDGKTLALATDNAAGLETPGTNPTLGPPNVRIPAEPPGSTAAKRSAPISTRDYIPWQSTTDTLRFWAADSSVEQGLLDPLPTLTALSRVAWARDRSYGGRNLLAAAGRDGTVWIWDMHSRKLLAHLFLCEPIRKECEAAAARRPPLVFQSALPRAAAAPLIAFSPDGTRLAACDRGGTIRFWETANWRELPAIRQTPAGTRILSYATDGSTLAVSNRGQIKLYDPRSNRLRGTVGEATAPDICSGKFSPDGRLLAFGRADGRVGLADMTADARVVSLVGHGDAVVSLDFTPDGRRLATGSWDATVRLWNMASKREVTVLDGHRGRVHAVAFSPDGSVLASGGEIDDTPEQGLGELFLWRTAARTSDQAGTRIDRAHVANR